MMCVEDHGEGFVWHTSTLSSKDIRSLACAQLHVLSLSSASCFAAIMTV